MVDILIDTAIVVDMLRNYAPALQWKNSLNNSIIGISVMVQMEIIKGVSNKREQLVALKFLNQFVVIHFTEDDSFWADKQLLKYQLSYQVGINDCLIAASAYRLQIPLYTRNSKHFQPLLGNLLQIPY